MKKICVSFDDGDFVDYENVVEYSMDGKWLNMICRTEDKREEYMVNTDKVFEINIEG